MKQPAATLAFAALLVLTASPSFAQTAAAPPPAGSGIPVAVTDPFVVGWVGGSNLTCMTFTNTSEKTIRAIRFGLSALQQGPQAGVGGTVYLDRVGTFSPGVAIKPPTKFLGSVNRDSPALQNCFTTFPAKVDTVLEIGVVKVWYVDGTSWDNPYPSRALATVNY
jgi:hypothetical protein